MGLRLLTGGLGRYTAIFINGTVMEGAGPGPGGPWVAGPAGLYVDRACSGGMSKGGIQGGAFTLDGPAGDQQALQVVLQVLVDHSVVEAFGGAGRARVTSRIYPTSSAGSDSGGEPGGGGGQEGTPAQAAKAGQAAQGAWAWGVEAYSVAVGAVVQGVSFEASLHALRLGWVREV